MCSASVIHGPSLRVTSVTKYRVSFRFRDNTFVTDLLGHTLSSVLLRTPTQSRPNLITATNPMRWCTLSRARGCEWQTQVQPSLQCFGHAGNVPDACSRACLVVQCSYSVPLWDTGCDHYDNNTGIHAAHCVRLQHAIWTACMSYDLCRIHNTLPQNAAIKQSHETQPKSRC